MLDQLKVAEVSAQNVTAKDWKKIQQLANEKAFLETNNSKGFLSFDWFGRNWTRVLVELGNIYLDRADNQVYDADVYQLVIDERLSTYFAGIVNQARQGGFDYLVIDPDKDSIGSLPVVYGD